MEKIPESAMHEPLAQYFRGQGYKVNCEVKDCDLTATKEGELIIVELKRSFSMTLLSQAVKRKELTDSVYTAVPVLPGKKSIPNIAGIKAILRRLEIGLILVRFMKTKTKIEILLHPYPFTRKNARKKKRAVIREIDGRFHEFNKAGIPATEERITAYKLQAIRTAVMLKKFGEAAPKILRDAGTGEKTQEILSNNVYGWFERVKRGVYTLHPAGLEALEKYGEVISKMEEPG